MKKGMVGFFVLFLAGCGPASVQNQNQIQESANIIGGKKVESTDPIAHSVVAIYSPKDTYLCTGTLISANTVLTAGHCVTGDPKSLVVIFGLDVKSEGIEVRKVSSEVRHEKYKEDDQSEGKNDIALVKFEGKLPTGYVPLPILTKGRGIKIASGTQVTFAGFGLDKNWLGNILGKSGVLRKVDAKLKNPVVTDTEVKIEDARRGTCSGDSGGPGLIKIDGQYYIWGITSRGGSLGSVAVCLKTGYYTRVEAYAGWIKAHVR